MMSSAEGQRLLQEGKVAEAERCFRQALESDPRDLGALNFLGFAALNRGEANAAREMLLQAHEVDPADPMTLHHLGLAHEAVGALSEAADAQRSAVVAAPHFYIARLYLGRVLERTGRTADAVIQYARALQDAQQTGRWLNPGTTPPVLRPMIEHAVLSVRRGRRIAYTALFEPLLARFGRSSLDRVERSLRIYLHEEPAEYADERQKPSFLYFPGLPATAFLDRSLFTWIPELEQQTKAIQAELMSLLPSAEGRERVFNNEALEEVNLRGLDSPPSWNGYYFYRHGERRAENCDRCPITAGSLTHLPLSHVREHGPEILFSVFTPGTHLLPHRGVTNTRLVGHLPLMVPEDCALNVGGELHHWKEGEVVIFDDTYEHEAWNRSKKTRVVLIFDIWNPYLTDAERLALASLISAIGDFRRSVDAG
jgi:aspartate beta-hydroxylase